MIGCPSKGFRRGVERWRLEGVYALSTRAVPEYPPRDLRIAEHGDPEIDRERHPCGKCCGLSAAPCGLIMPLSALSTQRCPQHMGQKGMNVGLLFQEFGGGFSQAMTGLGVDTQEDRMLPGVRGL